MTRESVLFRVDGTQVSGWESLARCQVIAAALQRRRRPCYFLSQLEPASYALSLKRSGNEWLEAAAPAGSPDDLEELTREVRRIRPAAVVVDSPQAGPDYLAELVALGPLVVAVDSAAAFRFPAQLVLNPTLAPGVEEYEVCPGTQVLQGRRYALVRPEIRRLRPVRAQEPPTPFRVLAALGDDLHCQSTRIVPLLLANPKIGQVDLIGRPQHPNVREWQALAEKNKGRMTLSLDTGEVASKVSRCHLAICDGAAWALEFACVGVPMLLIVQNERHWPTAQMLEEEGAATILGCRESVSDAMIKQAVQQLLADPHERRIMARSGRAFIDGRGPDRLITALEIMLHPSRRIGLAEAA
jgi:spore coat polysaccharide biosynthesis predicted glycosyltransferase SpsG